PPSGFLTHGPGKLGAMLRFVCCLVALGLIACGDNTKNNPVAEPTLQSIGVTPPNLMLAHGMRMQLAATGVYSDGTHQDLTAMVEWSSSTSAVATVDPAGLVTAVMPGTATITAKL